MVVRVKTRLVATCAAMSVALAALAPVLHRHGDEGHAVVHRHTEDGHPAYHEDGDAHHESGANAGDHAATKFLPLSYETTALFVLMGPLSAATTFVAAPASRIFQDIRRTTLLPTHDPPLRFVSSPAPPAAV